MTLDGFAGAERIAATLDVLAEALLDGRATHYPLDALTAFRRDAHPAADALFGLRLGSAGGHGVLTVRGLGTVVAGGSLRRPEPAAGAEQALVARYGAGVVRGVRVGPDAPAPDGASAAARFQLPVRPEPAQDAPRPSFTAPLAAFASARPVLEPEELPTGSGVQARLVVPSVFHPLTAHGGGPAVAAHLAEVAEEVFAGGDAAARRDWSVLTASLADEASAAGVIFAGLSALRAGDRISHASLVVSLNPVSGPADELAHRLADARPQAEVWTVLLPAGPAALLVEPRVLTVPASLAADGRPHRTVGSAVVAVLPAHDGATALMLQLATAQPDDWELYTGVFAEILQGVQLGWDGVAAVPPVAVESPAAQAPAHQPEPAPTPAPAPAPASPPAPVPAVAAEAAPSFAEPVPAAPPAAPPAAEPLAAAAPEAPTGTPVAVPPPDFNPFAPPAPTTAPAAPAPTAAPVAAAPGATAPGEGKGTPVRIPPPDFNPFAPPAPAAAPATAPATAAPADGKGTPVRIPPPDFNPFAPPAPSATPSAPAAAPAPAPVAAPAPPAAPAVADPFGTVVSNEPKDPFGTVTTAPAARPAAPAAPVPPPAAPVAAQPAAPGKGTPVRIPPPDFNPFAPPAPSTAPSVPAPAAPEEPPAYNPFG